MFRTHDCNSLRKSDIGRQVTLAGWVNVTRDHGGVIFIDLRDREGLTQVVFRPEENAELAKQAHTLRGEDVIQVSGTVAARLLGTENPNLATGDIEIIPSELRILNRAEPLPFPIDAEPQTKILANDAPIFGSASATARAQFADSAQGCKSNPRLPRQPGILSKLKRRFCPKTRRKARGISGAGAESRLENSTRCRRRRSNTNSSWSPAWKNIFRSQNVFVTKICAPIVNPSLRRSHRGVVCHSGRYLRPDRRNARGDFQDPPAPFQTGDRVYRCRSDQALHDT